MAYIALYRKYRPNTFDRILGQENVTTILKNQVKSGKISHAYIFSGSRGTGKTSAAKVFSRAINCLNPKDGEPCNECEICKSILDGNTTDVIEMDAASNNSVENIRQIRQEVVYATIDTKRRVYIIDEAHMLTTSAFNALLKTLEEPPENVIFILATTEQHKIPVTILSRCLRFEFNRISDDDIIKNLEYVLKEEDIECEDSAIKYIAKLADGGRRDALSILDRCITEYNEKLTYKDVERIIGAIDKNIIENIVENIINLDSMAAIKDVDVVVKKGKDLRQFISQITEFFLEKLIIEKLSDDDKNRYVYIIDKLSKLDNDIRLTSKPVIVLKAALVEMCNLSSMSSDSLGSNADNAYLENMQKKINMLEEKIAKLSSNNVAKTVNTTKSVNTLEINEKKVSTMPISESVISENKIDNKKILSDMKIENFLKMDDLRQGLTALGKFKIYSAMTGVDIYISDTSVILITNNSFAYNILKTEESINTLQKIFKESFNIDKYLRVEFNEKNEDNMNKLEKIFEENDIDYTNLD